MPDHRLAWRGVEPDRVDAAHVQFTADRLTARGTSVGAGYALQWALVTGPEYVTRELTVLLRSDTAERSLTLRRDPAGTWSAERSGDSLPLPDLSAALDCDLGLCPMTNTMPVLRHGLTAAARAGQQRSERFVMALVQVPELEVQASVQTYTALGPLPDGGALIRFSCDGFEADLELDAAGLVRHYPHIGTRIG